jgi:purine-nucleoside phosphorylase
MYKSLTAKERKKHFGMPPDYSVDGLLIMGGWDVPKYVECLRSILSKDYPDATINRMEHYNGFITLGYEIKVNGKLLWYFVLYGGPLVSEYTDLACKLGSKKNILVGVSGGLKPDAKTGDIVLPTASFKDGSMSTMYDPSPEPEVAPDEVLRSSLKKRLSHHAVHEGRTMTCQAMLCETWEDVQRWSSDGYIAVEMEAAALLAASKHYGVPGAAILSIADNLIEQETVVSDAFIDLAELRGKVRDDQFRVALVELLED